MACTTDHQELPPRVPNPLVDRLGTVTCVALDEYVADMVSFQLQDLRELRQELREEFRHEFQTLHQELAEIRHDISVTKAELRQEFTTALAIQKADIMKWMFTFWIGQAAVTVGLILATK